LARSRLILFVGLALLVAGTVGLAASGDLRQHLTRFLAFYVVAVAGFVMVWLTARRLGWKLALVVAILMRAALLPGHPSLSDDYYRYLWDGRVQVAGINPYVHAPDSRALDRVAFADRARVNHHGVWTIYPAAAELLFAGLARLGGGLIALKLLLGAFDALTAWGVAALAGARRRREAAVLYLLCPVVVLETWGSAHVEIVAVALSVWAAALVARRRDTVAGAALGLAAAVKLTPAFLVVPALVGGRARWRRFLPALALAFLLPYLPYLLSGAVLGSLSETGARPSGNAAVFWLLQRALPYSAARIAAGALFLVAAAAIAMRLRGRERTAETFAWTAMLVPLLLPIVEPWYWLAPVALAMAAGLVTPVVLGLAAPLAYPAWAPWFPQGPWERVVTYGPLLALVPELGARRRRSRRAPSSGTPTGA
jgi:alpha-1,6-mannosyltransferase